MTDTPPVGPLRTMVREELARYFEGLEERLAAAMTKALDTVETENRQRIRQLEEDQARIMRHLGLDSEQPDD